MIFVIAFKELRSLFFSPLAWSILAVLQFLTAYLFLGQLELFIQVKPRLILLNDSPGLTEIVVTPIFSNAALILLMVMPLLTMRLISEEKRLHTLSLLISSPISITEIVLGKYFAIVGFILIMLFMIALMPLALLLGGNLDYGMLAAGFLALFLLLSSFAAAGLYLSTLCTQPIIAAVSTFGLLLFLWIIDWSVSLLNPQQSSALSHLSMLKHYQPLLEGVFKSSDVIFYLLFIITFLILSIRKLDAERLQH